MVNWNKKIVVKSITGVGKKVQVYPARVLCTNRLSGNRNESCVVAVNMGDNFESVNVFKQDGTEYGFNCFSYFSYVENTEDE